ncbi:site-specific DNA-methyltransferase [Actinobacillus porcinus]|uniref:Methyltransferase n=1 Tax=Actinobacillus porcinus TaxID=51048 RepID=A0ABY6TLT2_9PAST|nr:site-specific DNA-methyltransferase [Actinobacillus porcinus]MCI5764129.1 site-specific DNA-methyltransferase [Actinobacillus porcinus]MDY5421353.1 site-specific DNA-methyltransferase [Actinobacillus porcinus]VFY93799.1 Modification methylase DpnIIB [Actinobacillus porcinus]VTU09171.1 Modification methylase DpnIIB [Actinobacillus porcinus]
MTLFSQFYETAQIFHADCFVKMQEMQSQGIKVDHIITDPPYSISTENQFHTMRNPRKGIDFGQWDWHFDPAEWLDLAFPLLDKDGSLIIFCSYKFISHICNKIEQLNGVVKDVLVWQKANPMPRNIHRRYVQDMEFAIWAVKSKKSKWVFNKSHDVAYQRAFFQTPTLLGKERTAHPTQKPIALMKDIIEIHTGTGDVIFDPFMGVGSTGVAALALGREFIGCEQDKEWFRLAQKRLHLS